MIRRYVRQNGARTGRTLRKRRPLRDGKPSLTLITDGVLSYLPGIRAPSVTDPIQLLKGTIPSL
jgi:hypothetical protein